jgi:hypothetical protein
MIKTVFRSHRSFQSKDGKAAAWITYEVGEMKSSIDTSFAVVANDDLIEVVCTFDEAMQSINRHWEKVTAEAVDRSIDKELKEKHLIAEF